MHGDVIGNCSLNGTHSLHHSLLLNLWIIDNVPFGAYLGLKFGPIPNAKSIFYSQMMRRISQFENFEK